MNYAFVTFGCRLNRAESLDAEARVAAAGDRVVPLGRDAQVIVVRGCCVTSRAQRDCERQIEQLRRQCPWAKIVVTGCLPGSVPFIPPRPAAGTGGDPVPRRTARAYLKVQDGCDCHCAYCVVPHYRGRSASLPLPRLLDRARAFLAAGYREIVLTGCNVVQYRHDGRDLCDLVAAIAGLEGPGHRVRLGSVEPGAIARKLVDVFAAHPNVCRFLHLSLQSGCDRVLGAMRRHYRIADVFRLVDDARAAMPDIAVGADIICGFPGESEADFLETRDAAVRLRIVGPHIFPFSARPKTEAAAMEGQIPHEIRRSRARELGALLFGQRCEFAKSFLGKVVEVCVESDDTFAVASRRRSDGAVHSLSRGWTSQHFVCGVTDRFVPRRQLARVLVERVDADRLHGVWTE